MIGNRMSKDIFSKSRYNNLWSKSIIVIFVLLLTLGIYWKKKRILLKIPKSQRNVLTLKQTVAVIFLVYTNNLLTDYILAIFQPTEFLFIMEELRVILLENILTRLLLPVLLILNTMSIRTLQHQGWEPFLPFYNQTPAMRTNCFIWKHYTITSLRV